MQAMTRLVLAAALPCLAVPALAVAPMPVASVGHPATTGADDTSEHLTLEQAVAQVQSQTHGKVLRAGSRMYGNMIEYRIKVLTPDGHVRVIPVRSTRETVHPPEHKPEETH